VHSTGNKNKKNTTDFLEGLFEYCLLYEPTYLNVGIVKVRIITGERSYFLPKLRQDS